MNRKVWMCEADDCDRKATQFTIDGIDSRTFCDACITSGNYLNTEQAQTRERGPKCGQCCGSGYVLSLMCEKCKGVGRMR